MALINNSVKLGKGDTNLVLETAGHVYIKVADRFYELDFKNENKGTSTTVINNTVEAPEVDLSGYVSKKYLKSALNNYVTVRNWNDVKQTQSMLENAMLEGFTESINPITVQTMQLIVGTESLQFDFVKSLLNETNIPESLSTKPELTSGSIHLLEGDILKCPSTFIMHYTLDGSNSVQPFTDARYYARWTVEESSHTLSDESASYYVYIKAPIYDARNNSSTSDEAVERAIGEVNYAVTHGLPLPNPIPDPRGALNASYVVSETAIPIDAEQNYYYLLCALVTDKSGGARSIAYTNGFTEILPGQITAYIFKSGDGVQYLDFLNKVFHLGYAAELGDLLPTTGEGAVPCNDGSYMHWDPVNGLIIKGKLSVLGGDVEEILRNLQAQIDDEIQTWFSDDTNNDNEEGHKHDVPTLTSWPANTWLDDVVSSGAEESEESEESEEESELVITDTKKSHIGDLFYIMDGDYQGNVYRFVKQNNLYTWVLLNDNALAEALLLAHQAQNTANTVVNYITQSLSDGVLTIEELNRLEGYIPTLESQYKLLTSSYEAIVNEALSLLEELDPESALYTQLNNAILALYNDGVNPVTGSYADLNACYQSILTVILGDSDHLGILDYGVTPTGQTEPALANLSTALENALEGFNAAISPYSNDLQVLQQTITNFKIGSFSYLTEALNQDTTILGGLILTSAILFRDRENYTSITLDDGTEIQVGNYDNIPRYSAGVNGIRKDGDWYRIQTNPEQSPAEYKYYSKSPALWMGGAFVDRTSYYDYVPVYNDPRDSTSGINHYEWVVAQDDQGHDISHDDADIPTALFRHDGTGYLADGNIVWNLDGSGSVAGGKIWWDAEGNVSVPGLTYYKDSQNNWYTDLDLDVQVDDPTNSGNKITLRDVILNLFGMFTLENIGSEEEAEWVIKANYGLYSDDFITAGGLGSSSGGGSGGADLPRVWQTLVDDTNETVGAYNRNLKIAQIHLPTLSIVDNNNNSVGSVANTTSGFNLSTTTLSINSGTSVMLSTGTDNTNRLWSASVLNSFIPAWAKKSSLEAADVPSLSFDKITSGAEDLKKIEALTGSGLLKRASNGNWSLDSRSFLTGNQTITLSGIISGSGETSITTSMADNALSISKVNGLQTALNGKQDAYGFTISGTNNNTYNLDNMVSSISITGGSSNGTIKLTVNGTSTDNIAVTGVWHQGNAGSTSYTWAASSLTLNGAISGATNIDGLITFDTTNSRIGIGINNPTKTFEVIGQSRFGSSSTPSGLNSLQSNSVFGISSSSNKYLFIWTNSSAGFIQCGNPSSSGTSIPLYIQPYGGNVGIGNSNASYPLDVTGVIHSSAGVVSDGYVTAGTAASSSDIRLKTNIQNINEEDAINIIMSLKPKKWIWNNNNQILKDKECAGLISQEVSDIIPFAVIEETTYQSLNYNVFHAYEISSIKNHELRIKMLEEKINKLNI